MRNDRCGVPSSALFQTGSEAGTVRVRRKRACGRTKYDGQSRSSTRTPKPGSAGRRPALSGGPPDSFQARSKKSGHPTKDQVTRISSGRRNPPASRGRSPARLQNSGSTRIPKPESPQRSRTGFQPEDKNRIGLEARQDRLEACPTTVARDSLRNSGSKETPSPKLQTAPAPPHHRSRLLPRRRALELFPWGFFEL